MATKVSYSNVELTDKTAILHNPKKGGISSSNPDYTDTNSEDNECQKEVPDLTGWKELKASCSWSQ